MTPTAFRPAYTVQTARTVLRCWSPADAPLALRAIEASLEHLRPWMEWAKRYPMSVEQQAGQLRRMRGVFDLGQDFAYGVFSRDGSEVLGGTGLHPRVGEGALEIGYWISASHTGRGLATEMAGALTRVAFEVEGVRRVEIHCDPRNVRSSAVARRLGFVHEGTLRQRLVAPDGALRDTMIWTLLVEEYAASPAAATVVEAFDVLGQKLL
ncbi:GNAT family N-acetyltransferase [Corallococcus exiguus]|uniref:GNAT family N-acetyltransferase n=1 Tax=Corallococcus TaxID=83461 RepID=UPI000EA30B33|nr:MULTISPECIES: GNAT family protein [Corallococcus]NNC18621.1 GNAT family N-acetyltransferase [Corallococcus exiguus]NRD53083.1 GNAT family N-acetyltransferase [Corallococcus exiguus]NRD60479.1 GNAT family N-acetyltransferase [Corallococcus exiguus]RKH28221.1 N-acetyltransferase [Corallococcus sp. CA041A]RUO91854.1 N-acetyltransferase [Corallococcus sp. AB018]